MRSQLAIVVGNDDYENETYFPSLPCAEKDVDVFSEVLRKLGFEVVLLKNLSKHGMHTEFERIKSRCKGKDTLLFFYAGHGLMDYETRMSYLVPVDAGDAFFESGNLKYFCYRLNDLINIITCCTPPVKLLFFDACRSAVSPGMRGTACSGIGEIYGPRGTLVSYSTSPGSPALENCEFGHSYYMKALLDNIDKPRIPIEAMLKSVRQEVYSMTNHRQVTWDHSSLVNDYYFNPDLPSISGGYPESAFDESPQISDPALLRHWQTMTHGNWDAKKTEWQALNRWIRCVDASISATDLFVGGRLLGYLMIDGFFAAQKWFEDFYVNAPSNMQIRKHLLNGIGYETYLQDRKLRGNYDSHLLTLLNRILLLPESEANRSFLRNKIKIWNPDRLVCYEPGSGRNLNVTIKESEMEEGLFGEPWRASVGEIYVNGMPALFVDSEYNLTIEGGSRNPKEVISRKTGAPMEMINLSFPSNFDPSDYCLSGDFKLVENSPANQ